ncbi:MAG: hypothetical protein IPM91_20410 [Bacteroidetes bacterium]|nr:hypothetical protein [Bacteroidota bacterium]
MDLVLNTNPGTLNNFDLTTATSNWSGGYAGTVYADTDGDGFGNPNNSTTTTSPCFLTGYVSDNTDCDDTNINIYPVRVVNVL